MSNTSKYSTVEKFSGHRWTITGRKVEDAVLDCVLVPQNWTSIFSVFRTSFGCILSFNIFSISNFNCTMDNASYNNLIFFSHLFFQNTCLSQLILRGFFCITLRQAEDNKYTMWNSNPSLSSADKLNAVSYYFLSILLCKKGKTKSAHYKLFFQKSSDGNLQEK